MAVLYLSFSSRVLYTRFLPFLWNCLWSSPDCVALIYSLNGLWCFALFAIRKELLFHNLFISCFSDFSLEFYILIDCQLYSIWENQEAKRAKTLRLLFPLLPLELSQPTLAKERHDIDDVFKAQRQTSQSQMCAAAKGARKWKRRCRSYKFALLYGTAKPLLYVFNVNTRQPAFSLILCTQGQTALPLLTEDWETEEASEQTVNPHEFSSTLKNFLSPQVGS